MNLLTPNKCVFIAAAAGLCIYAGTKHPTNPPPMMCAPPMTCGRALAPSPRLRTLRDIRAWPDEWFAMPAEAATFDPWNKRGAVEDWTPVSVGSATYVALVNGVLRILPRSLVGELGLASIGPDGAVPQQSRLWWMTESNGTHVVTWEKFLKSGLDAPYSLQLRIDDDSYAIRTNGVFASTYAAYDPTLDTTLDLALEAPQGVFVEGDRRPLTLVCSSDRAVEGHLRLEQTSGEGLVSLWTATNGGSSVSLPVEFDAATFADATYYVQAESASEAVGDVAFAATLVGDGPDPRSRTASDTTTSVEILFVDVTSSAQGVSTNPPPFAPGEVPVFSVTKSGSPDRHLVVPFRNVAGDDLVVSNFTIETTVVTLPDGYSESVAWERLENTPTAGTFSGTGFAQSFVHPDEGGVYRFKADVGGVTCGWTAVLPLAGAEIDEVVGEDLLRADDFVDWARDRFPSNVFAQAWFGWEHFCTHDNGYYLGRPDATNTPHQTVWQYNQVDNVGMGAVVTLYGYPTRFEKMSNLVCAYTCERLGVPAWEQSVAQVFGTTNDVTATASWNAGRQLAHAFLPTLTLPAVASNMWQQTSDVKTRKLWPNPARPNNFPVVRQPMNYDWLFYSPGFLVFGI